MSPRLLLRKFHLWIGVSVGLFLMLITLSGIVLMFETRVDKWTHPDLYAVSGAGVAGAPEVYLAKAREAVPNGEPFQLRYPEEDGFPVVVPVRINPASANRAGGERQNGEHRDGDHRGSGDRQNRADNQAGEGRPAGGRTEGMGAGRPRVVMVYLDPPTAKVLGTADPRASFAGWAKSLHTDLLMPAFGGRQIVGWIGAGLFILCLTGLYLWWPRYVGFLRGLRWRRGPTTSINLHHRIGFWIVIPLGVMAFTGFLQGLPQIAHAMIGAFAPVAERAQRNFNAALPQPRLTAQRVIELASLEEPTFHPTQLNLPQEPSKAWRVQLSNESGETATVLIDDADETISAPPEPLKGDAILFLLRRIHEGYHDGPVWQTIVFLTALTPPLFFVTGILMWLRRRKGAAALARMKTGSAPVVVTPPLGSLGQDNIAV